MSAWRETTWGSVSTLSYGKAIRGYQERTKGIPVFGTNGQIGFWDVPLQNEPGVIVGRKGAYRGVHFSPGPFFVIDTAFALKTNPEVNARWAYYCLLGADINSMDSGSAIPSTNRDEFYAMPLLLPPLPDQQSIAATLGVLDDKIELNCKTAATLGEMARALYRSWFVDFDPVGAKAAGRAPAHMDAATAALFPDSFGTDGLPAGWKTSPVGNLCDQAKQTVKPMEAPDRDFHHFSLPAYDTGALPAFEKGSEIKSNKLFVPNDAILFSRLNPSIPRVWWARTDEALATPIASTEFYVARAMTSSATPWLYCLLSSAGFRENALARVTGTSNSHQRVPPTALTEIEVTEPSADIIEAFGAMAGPLFEKIHAMKAESQTLASLRDTLLPKLISGELRVREAREQIEEVA